MQKRQLRAKGCLFPFECCSANRDVRPRVREAAEIAMFQIGGVGFARCADDHEVVVILLHSECWHCGAWIHSLARNMVVGRELLCVCVRRQCVCVCEL